ARFDLLPDASGWISSDHLHVCHISPDGALLAITRGPDAPIEIHSLRGEPTRIIPARGIDKITVVKWAPDETGLFVSKQLYDGGEIVYVDLRGRTHSLWRSHGGTCFGRPSPDGRHLAIYDWEWSKNVWMMENF